MSTFLGAVRTYVECSEAGGRNVCRGQVMGSTQSILGQWPERLETGRPETWLLRLRRLEVWEDGPSEKTSWESCLPI